MASIEEDDEVVDESHVASVLSYPAEVQEAIEQVRWAYTTDEQSSQHSALKSLNCQQLELTIYK